MPHLDVSDVLLDADFLDTLQVTRNTQTVGSNGMAVNATKTWEFFGVVTSHGGHSLKREADGERSQQRILVITTMRLIDGRTKVDGTAQSADILTWDGSTYTVVNVDPYRRYGAGFVQAECELIPVTG